MAKRLLHLAHRFIAGEKADAITWFRLPKDVSSRTIPKPNLPHGPAHKLSANYYFNRDPRRAVQQVTLIANTKNAPAQIAAPAASANSVATATASPAFVGNRMHWSAVKEA